MTEARTDESSLAFQERMDQGDKDRGQLAYEAAENIASQISQIPEFRVALAEDFFTKRSDREPYASKRIVFEKGDYRYVVSFSLGNSSEGSELQRMHLDLDKWNAHDPQSPLLAELRICSKFYKKDGQMDFQRGHIILTSDRRTKPDLYNQYAIDSLPVHFRDILSQPQTIRF